MPATYDSLATTTLGANANNITFSSIPSGYTDLRLVVRLIAASNGDNTFLRFNGDTATNYSVTPVVGTGAGAQSNRTTNANAILVEESGTTSGVPYLIIADIFSYSNTSMNKTALSTTSYDKNGSGQVRAQASLWRSTAAINSVSVNNFFNNFAAGSTATLYGILRA